MVAVKSADKIIVNLIDAYLARIFLNAVDSGNAFLKEKMRDGLRVLAMDQVIAFFAV